MEIEISNGHQNGSKKGRKKKNKNKGVSTYRYVSTITETPSSPIFSVAFNHLIKDRKIFSTVSKNKVSIYECIGESEIKLIRVYMEPDQEEVFNTVNWGFDGRNGPVLAAAGVKGVVRLIYCNFSPSNCYKNLIGHTGPINDVKFHPIKHYLLFTCSKDCGIRMWDTMKMTCVALFSGIEGHRDEILSIDISIEGDKMISGGIDHNILIWDLNVTELEKEKVTKRIHFPYFSTRDIHGNYVDCVKFFGDGFLSKSCESKIIYWRIIEDLRGKLVAEKLFTFEVDECDIWYVKMSVDPKMNFLAVGNQKGKINIFNISNDFSPQHNRKNSLIHFRSTSTIRDICFSSDSDILIAVCDNGTIWRWNKKQIYQ